VALFRSAGAEKLEEEVSDPGRVRVAEEGQEAPAVNMPEPAPRSKPEDVCNLGAAALIELTGVSPDLVERAERIRGRMENPGPLGEVLVKMGAISAEDLEKAKQQQMARMSVAEILHARGQLTDKAIEVYQKRIAESPAPSDREVLVGGSLVSEEQYLKALSTKLDIPYVEPQIGDVDASLYKKITFAYLLNNMVMPVRVEDGQLEMIVAQPEDDQVIVELERTFGHRTKLFCSTSFRIGEALRTLERLKGKPADAPGMKIQYRELDSTADGPDDTGDEAIQLVDYLLGRAVQLGASDLHIEPTQNRVRVRARIDGVLQQLSDLPVDYASRVTARIKILARADVTEKRNHQDGKIHIRLGGQEIDIRVSTYVSVFGETIVMRFLNRERGIVPLEKIGFQPRVYTALKNEVLRTSSGMVLVVGPTGSGKTTTLYSFIDHANDPSQKVITCEDPVEYVIDGIVQCTVDTEAGRTFGESLRAIVRQDPDTIVVGEIRDKLTASLAVEAALTGHKVFSTFHTEESVRACVRLLEMGVDPFLVSSTVSAVVAQRLVRLLCPDCRVPHRPTTDELRFLKLNRSDLTDVELFGPGGCEKCGALGYKGRLAVHEVLIPNDDLRAAVFERAPADQLRKQARTLPEFSSMQEDGLIKAMSGRTSLAEIIANTPRDMDPRPMSVLRGMSQSWRAS
jgi:type IV pilus assembly protein PilB